MRYEIAPQIFARFPGFRRAVVLADGIDNSQESKELTALLRAAEEKVRGEALAAFPDLPRLNIWVDAFKALGINPKKNPPSVLNMIKRVRSGKDLPYVNSLVAIFNSVSLDTLISCGGDDLARVKGGLLLTESDGTENYSPLGQPDVRENPVPGEVIYMDTGSREIFCRAWCWKNGDVSKLRPETRRAAINIDGMLPAVSENDLSLIAETMVERLRLFTGAQCSIKLLSPDSPGFEMD